MTVDTIRDQLKALRLPQASLALEAILEKRKTKTDIGWVSLLLEAELDQRKDNAVEKRIVRAGFPERRSLEQFDWSFNEKLPRSPGGRTF